MLQCFIADQVLEGCLFFAVCGTGTSSCYSNTNRGPCSFHRDESSFIDILQRISVAYNLCSISIQEQFLSLPAAKANEYKRKAYAKRSIRKILNFLLLEKSDVNEGLKSDFPKYKEDVQKLVAYIERGKAHNAEMNTGYQLRNCREEPQVINLTGNASSISGGKR